MDTSRKDEITRKLLEILREIRPENDFAGSQDYISDGLLDSFDVITLVSKLEAHYGILIDGENVRAENFRNLKTLESFILEHLTASTKIRPKNAL